MLKNHMRAWHIMSAIRPGKVDSLFPINHFPNFEASGWSLFIIDYAKVILPGAIHACFSQNHGQIRGRGTSKR